MASDGITTIITRGGGCAVEVVTKRICFTRGEDGHFRRPGSDVMHHDVTSAAHSRPDSISVMIVGSHWNRS